MEIPTLPTDNAHKFLAVGCLVLSIVCAFASYKLYEQRAQRLSTQATAMMNAPGSRQLLSEPSPQDTPPRNAAEVRLRENAREMARMIMLPTRELEFYGALTAILSGVYQLAFFLSMWKWLRTQRVADAVAALELAEKMKKHGKVLELELPQKMRV